MPGYLNLAENVREAAVVMKMDGGAEGGRQGENRVVWRNSGEGSRRRGGEGGGKRHVATRNYERRETKAEKNMYVGSRGRQSASFGCFFAHKLPYSTL